ncbi:MAG: DEAD/DEAH box helicase [Bacillota bacterium]
MNNYDGSQEAENSIRDLVCFLSDSDEHMNNGLYRSVIFEAAQRLRVFGYIKGYRKISIDEVTSGNAYDVKHQAIQNYYASKVFGNNLLDRRQKDIIDTYMTLDRKRIIVSAPTAFGKTFILREIIFLNRHRYKNILLVFPTIALLNENTQNIKELMSSVDCDYNIVNNVYSGIDLNERHIFILTPERTLKLLSDHSNLGIDFFFFDEVYKIDEDFSYDENSQERNRADFGNRAKVFRITLYLLSNMVPEFYLAGPYLNLDNLKEGFYRYLCLNSITPIQVNFEPTICLEIDAWKKKSTVHHPLLGDQDIEIHPKAPKSTPQKIANIARYLHDKKWGQAIFYCSTPRRSMDYANGLIMGFEDGASASRIDKTFIDHLERKYGVKVDGFSVNSARYWSLIRALKNGYGIHHGKFPKYIQNEILRMFNHGDFDYLFCTSTIIEGVNTSAKNVVIINSSVGQSQMSQFALKNIKGRAGRYYHHSVGRVFLTDSKQRAISDQVQTSLDFPTYSHNPLMEVDLDSASIADLIDGNKIRKRARDSNFDFDKLPDLVFAKNRLYPRDVQEKYLDHLLVPKHFDKFSHLIENSSNIRAFIDGRMIRRILETLEGCGIIESNLTALYHAVVSNYSRNGTVGLITHHIRNQVKYRDNLDEQAMVRSIDKAYIHAFDQIRSIVEYEVPKLLCLFEAIYQQAGVIRGYDMSDFNMSAIIRYFELGITTEFGLSLVEYGFPVDTIRLLEKKFERLASYSSIESIRYLRERSDDVLAILDEFEIELFRRAVKSIES